MCVCVCVYPVSYTLPDTDRSICTSVFFLFFFSLSTPLTSSPPSLCSRLCLFLLSPFTHRYTEEFKNRFACQDRPTLSTPLTSYPPSLSFRLFFFFFSVLFSFLLSLTDTPKSLKIASPVKTDQLGNCLLSLTP